MPAAPRPCHKCAVLLGVYVQPTMSNVSALTSVHLDLTSAPSDLASIFVCIAFHWNTLRLAELRQVWKIPY